MYVFCWIDRKRSLSADDDQGNDGDRPHKRRFDEGGSRQEVRLLVQSQVNDNFVHPQ
jgi:hypothetical protein